MKVLVLINGAPSHRPFFARVGEELVARGHSVVYAVDSHYTDVMYPGAPLRGEVHYLSDYFRKHRGRAVVPSELRGVNLSLAMFSDYERLNHPSGAAGVPRERRTPGYYHDLVASMAAFFWDLFETHHFDRVVYECVSNSFSYVAYLVAHARGATYVGFSGSRLTNRFEVSTTQYHRDPRLPGVYGELSSGARALPPEVRAEVEAYLERFFETPPAYMLINNSVTANPLKRYARAESLLRVVRSLRYTVLQREDFTHAFQVGDSLKVYPTFLAWEVRRSLRARQLRKHFYKQPDLNQRYFVYPVQFHPESSTSVNAPFYVDELSLIRNVAMSLPLGTLLYVKDHQHVVAARQPLAFYEEVSRIPNVVLIDPAVPPKALVSRSLGVIAGTSTMGYEAIVLGKPVFVFGTTFYDFHPMCVKIASYANTFDALQRAETMRTTKEDIFNFVAAYHLCTFRGTYDLTGPGADAALVASISRIIEAPPAVDAA